MKPLAIINESLCVGCTKCIAACPFDAIVGAEEYTHTVIASECTGCELCVAPCPVDCIEMVSPPETEPESKPIRTTSAKLAKERYRNRQIRLNHKALEQDKPHQAKLKGNADKLAYIRQAQARTAKKRELAQ